MVWRATNAAGDRISSVTKERIRFMFMTVAIVLVVLWALGFFAVNIGGGLIHILLVLALIAFIYSILVGRRPV